MTMSQIQTLQLWNEGVKACDGANWAQGLTKFSEISDPAAAILFNMGCTQLVLRSYQEAIEYFNRALEKDNYMAVGYFQRAVGFCKCSRWNNAEKDFEKCLQNFRGKNVIDYKKLGLRSNLHICEVQYNLAITNAKLGQAAKCRSLLTEAATCKVETRHRCIDEAITNPNPGSMPFLELPNTAIFTPPRDKMRNLEKQAFIQPSKVVSALEPEDKDTGFMGPKRIKEVQEKIQGSKSAPTSPVSTRKQEDYSSTSNRQRDRPLNNTSTPPNKPAPRLPPTTQPTRPPLKDVLQKLDPDSTQSNMGNARKHSADDIFSVKHALRPTQFSQNNMTRSTQDEMTSKPTRPEKPGKLAVPQGIPPPTRPAPGFEIKPLPNLPGASHAAKNSTKEMPPSFPSKHTKVSVSDMIRVKFECHSAMCQDVQKGTSLRDLTDIACQLFDLNRNNVDLWYLGAAQRQSPITNDTQMQKIWNGLKENHLHLWCYGK